MLKNGIYLLDAEVQTLVYIFARQNNSVPNAVIWIPVQDIWDGVTESTSWLEPVNSHSVQKKKAKPR